MNEKCPICKSPTDNKEPYFPFCSERCKLIDLGNWASEKYVISTPLRKDPSVAERPGTDGSDAEGPDDERPAGREPDEHGN